jgi:hypothetical protein
MNKQYPDCRIDGKTYVLSETEKAVKIGMSASFLQKDRLKVQPLFDFAKVGRTVRYSQD